MPEHSMPDVIRVVKLSGLVVQPVHPDVVQEASGAHQVSVQVSTRAGVKLCGDAAHDQAVRIDKVERFGRRRVLLVQGKDFPISRNPHATAA